MLVRHAEPARDAAACAAIYAPYVAGTPVSFEEVAPTEAQFAAHIAATSERYPWLVAEDAGAVAGYAYATQHRARAGYRWAVDVAVYVDPAPPRRHRAAALRGAAGAAAPPAPAQRARRDHAAQRREHRAAPCARLRARRHVSRDRLEGGR